MEKKLLKDETMYGNKGKLLVHRHKKEQQKLINEETIEIDPIFKSINLNNSISEDHLKNVLINDKLAKQLMMQDDKIEEHHLLNF